MQNQLRPKSFEEITGTDVDSEGVFKYIQINVQDKSLNQTKTIVRGYVSCPYHADILSKFTQEEMSQYANQFDAQCPGGGRIEHTPAENKLNIYGYSQGFGRPDHTVAQALVQEKYPGYEVTWSNDGY